jgi:hypothetical protein
MFLSKYIGTKSFYKYILALALPIMFQTAAMRSSSRREG